MSIFIVSPILIFDTIRITRLPHLGLSFLYSCSSIGLFAKAGHDPLSSLRGDSLNSLYWFSEIPSTLTSSVPGQTTSIRRMYLEAVRGFSQTVLCKMVDVESPANAREIPPPDRKECIED